VEAGDAPQAFQLASPPSLDLSVAKINEDGFARTCPTNEWGFPDGIVKKETDP